VKWWSVAKRSSYLEPRPRDFSFPTTPTMMSTWFGSRASRGSRLPQTTPPLSQPHQLAKTEIATLPTDSSVLKHSQSISTLEPPAAFSPSSSRSGALLSDVHVNINDPSAYGAGSLSPIPVDVRAREDPAEAFTSLDLDDTYPAVDLKKDKGKGREIEGPGRPLFTPQDAVLTEVFGFPLPANPEATTTTLSDSDPMPHSSVATGGSAPLAPLPLYDPFSGARIGDHTSPATSTATANTTSTTGVEQPGQQQNKSHCLPMTGDSDLWSHLSRVLELQAEVAGMHAEMEGVGVAGSSAGGHGGVRLGPNSGTSDTRPPGVNAGIKRRMKGATMPVGDDDEPPQQVRSADGAVTDSSSEDEDKDDAKGFAKRRRDEDFAKLADQFTERKIAIARIMGKVRYFDFSLGTLTQCDAAGRPIRRIKGVPRASHPAHGLGSHDYLPYRHDQLRDIGCHKHIHILPTASPHALLSTCHHYH